MTAPSKLRAAALERDRHTCCNCGEPAAAVHHIVPTAKGGRQVLGNLVSLCHVCHGLVHESRMVSKAHLAHEGQLRARAAGVKLGRKRGWSFAQAEHIHELLQQGLSQREVAARMGMPPTTVRRAAEAHQAMLEAGGAAEKV